ncbi:hypothetical protein AX774_g3491 [Zancudomyces culisetae]|uniref:Uncharacterized protein n=1 Tax=Zancudomyces culisetae TaxID=1213189 RepID=A0A1R1PPW9_ZANCU|nr:hypothetical protein AX774_g3491 [Zancudomyces culisetae]|eukprot:OMH83014.1 hypothetical protein AX774_g3491 [Zancudomyces culisetae]
MHPTDHISTALEYSLYDNMISGALYHLVATYSVMSPAPSPPCTSTFTPLANPKSHTFKSQFEFSNRLLGFKSLWRTFAECIYFSARSV